MRIQHGTKHSLEKFKNLHRKLENQVTIYADFEAFQESVTETISDKNKLICEQKPTGFAYMLATV